MTINQELMNYLDQSPTAFHAVDELAKKLKKDGYTYLMESERWVIEKGGKYYTTRNGSSIVAFTIGETVKDLSFNIVASHSDSPSFKVKPDYTMQVHDKYIKLNTEGYGGMILSTWLDRPLTIAGRLLIQEGNTMKSVLVHVKRPLLSIPSVAIHLNRQANDGYKFMKQVDLLPLLGMGDKADNDLIQIIKQDQGITGEVVSHDLFVVSASEAYSWGAHEEFISSSRIDNLQCAFTTYKGFVQGTNPNGINIYACFDNEEVGSRTKQGADGTLLYDVLVRINHGLHGDEETFRSALGRSMMVSADNAHALHPNHPEHYDPTNVTYMNHGIVIKHHANQGYTTDGLSSGLFKIMCAKAEVPVQEFTNHSDKISGGTLGSLSLSHVSVPTVDIGIGQLAMHSLIETTGSKDSEYMVKAIASFCSHPLSANEDGGYTLND